MCFATRSVLKTQNLTNGIQTLCLIEHPNTTRSHTKKARQGHHLSCPNIVLFVFGNCIFVALSGVVFALHATI